MKKNYFTLLVLIFSVIFSSCSDDGDWRKDHGLKISKVYKGDNLELFVNDNLSNKGRVQLVANEQENAEISLLYIIPGEDSLIVSNIRLENIGNSKNNYSFVGQVSSADRIVNLEGKVEDSKMTISVNRTVSGNIVGAWKGSLFTNQVSFNLDIELKSSSTGVIDMHGLFGVDTIPVMGEGTSFQELMYSTLSLMLSVMGPTLEFQSNGNLDLAWSPLAFIEPGSLPENYLHYNIKDDNLYLTIPLDSILNNLKIDLTNLNMSATNGIDAETVGPIIDLVQKAYNGLPLKYTITEETIGTGSRAKIYDALNITVTKEMMVPYMGAIFSILEPLMKGIDWNPINEQLGGMGLVMNLNAENIGGFLKELTRVMNESEKFDLKIQILNANKKN